jgi:hypothetical protein
MNMHVDSLRISVRECIHCASKGEVVEGVASESIV